MKIRVTIKDIDDVVMMSYPIDSGTNLQTLYETLQKEYPGKKLTISITPNKLNEASRAR